MELQRFFRLVGLVAVLSLASTVLSPNLHVASAAAAPASTTACPATVNVSAPAADLASRVASAAPGTCFVLANGTYRFHDVVPKDGMSFVGQSTEGVVVDGRGHENAFHGTADGVTIARMTFQDFDSSAGTKRQEQSPIRGTARLWASDPGMMATNWVIDSIISQRNYAAGIFVGDHFTVRNSTFRYNGVTGMSGDSFIGGLFENNIVHGNGAFQYSGAEVNGGGLKFGQAGSAAHPVVVRNNEVFDNPNIGIWCDIGCKGFHVIDNYVHNHVSRGIMYELSVNLVVRGNRVIDSNTWTNHLGDFNAGAITVGESANAVIENNYIENARSGVVVRQTRRPVRGEEFLNNYPFVNWRTSNITVRNNVHVGVANTGISTGQSGNGMITDPGSITYTGNTYDSMGSMTFWWNNGQRMSAAQWQAAGRDTVANGSAPTSNGGNRGPDGSGFDAPTPPTTAAPAPPATVAPTPSTTTPPAPVTTPVESATRSVELPLRINSGGLDLIGPDGERWIADEFYIGGNVANHAAGRQIENTDADPLYRAERWGATGYDIPVGAGTYIVRLHHAEVFSGCQSEDCRAFSVTVEGQPVVEDVDVFAEVGGYSALVVDSVAAVEDGVLSIRFAASRQNPQVSGIEVLAVPAAIPVVAPVAETSEPASGSEAPETAPAPNPSTPAPSGDTTAPVPGPPEASEVPTDDSIDTTDSDTSVDEESAELEATDLVNADEQRSVESQDAPVPDGQELTTDGSDTDREPRADAAPQPSAATSNADEAGVALEAVSVERSGGISPLAGAVGFGIISLAAVIAVLMRRRRHVLIEV